MHLFGLLGLLMIIIGLSFAIYLGIDKLLINKVGKLISPLTLTEEAMETQFYDKVDEKKESTNPQ